VLTARNKDGENHQVRIRKEQTPCRVSGVRSGARDGTQVFAARQVAQMLAADAGQPGNFFFGENCLTRLYSDHLSTFDLRAGAIVETFVKNRDYDTDGPNLRAIVLPFLFAANRPLGIICNRLGVKELNEKYWRFQERLGATELFQLEKVVHFLYSSTNFCAF
jgi:hypothetical protein